MGRHSNAPSRGRKTQVRPSTFGLFWIVLSGCHTDGCDVSGLKEMAAKEPRGVDFPGQELGPVTSFRPLHALGRNGELTAIAGVNDSGEVLLVPEGGAEPCTVATLPEGASVSLHLPGALEDMLAVLESTDDSGSGSLSLYDARCERIGSEFANARFVTRSERLVPLRMLVIENGSELVAINAGDRERELIDRDVVLVNIMSEYVAVHAGGELVIRNMALEEYARFGSNVTEVAFGRNGSVIAYVDDGRVYSLASPEAKPKHLDDNACGLGFADEAARSGDDTPRFLSYYSPCEESLLTAYDLSRDARIEVGTAPSSRAAARVVGTSGERVTAVFYESEPADDSDEASSLSVAVEGEEPLLLGDGSLEYVGRATTAGVALWLDPDTDESRIARAAAPLRSEVETLLSGVVDFELQTYPERALVSGDDDQSSLVAIEGYSEPTEVAEKSPGVGRGTGSFSVFGSDTEGDVGTLWLLQTGAQCPVEVADQVAISTASLAFSGESLFYLGSYDTEQEAGELCMQVVRNGDTYCEPGVTAFRVFVRPKRAVAYVKTVGSRARLFWAAVQ